MNLLSFVQIGSIGVAGALGALARYTVGRFIAERFGSQFPLLFKLCLRLALLAGIPPSAP